MVARESTHTLPHWLIVRSGGYLAWVSERRKGIEYVRNRIFSYKKDWVTLEYDFCMLNFMYMYIEIIIIMVAMIKLHNLCMYLLDSQDGRPSRYEQSCQHYTMLQCTCMHT